MFCPNCGGQNADGATNCVTCGTAMRQPSGKLGRSGDELIVPQGATLPSYCVKCGQPSDQLVNKNFSWHHPLLYILALSPIIYIIVALIVSKRMRLGVPMCSQHYSARKQKLMLGWALFLGSIPLGIIVGNLGQDNGGVGFLVWFATFIAGCIVLAMGSRMIWPKEINAQQGRFAGAAPAFLDLAAPQSMSAGIGR